MFSVPRLSQLRLIADTMADRFPSDPDFRGKLTLVLSWTLFIFLLFLLVWLAAPVLFLFFGAILFAVFLRTIADLVQRFTHLSPGLSLAVGTTLFVAVVAGGVALLAPFVSQQFTELSNRLPESIASLRDSLGDSRTIASLFDQIPSLEEIITGEIGLSRVTGWFSSTIGLIANVILLLFVGLYLAANPDGYRNGLVRLFPRRRRARVDEILLEIGSTLRWWLLGQMIEMTIIGVLTTIGLWILGVPMALALGIIAAALTFVPNFGPIAAVIPAALLGLMISPAMMLYVLLLYAGVQLVESYMITPQVHKRTVTLPPVLTIVSQVLFGILFGLPGLFFATPLTAVILVLVKMAYVEDVLGDHARLPSEIHRSDG